MNTNRLGHACRVLGAAIALAATVCGAALAEPSPYTPTRPIDVAPAASAASPPRTTAASQRRYAPGEAGVRRAAAQGSDALRRYIWRTRMIYNYYYPDFAKRQ